MPASESKATGSSHDDELRTLRERAYGPGADIHDDPVAMARLSELEAAAEREAAAAREASTGTALAASTDPGGDHARDEESDETGAADPDGGPSDGDRAAEAADVREGEAGAEASVSASQGEDDLDDPRASVERPARRPRLPRRVLWLWAASVAVALFVGAALTMAMGSWSGERAAVLPETDISDWPELSFGEPDEGARIFEDYLGLTPVIVPNALGSDNQQRVPCMFVVILSDYDGGDPPGTAATTVTAGCAAGSYPPVASFTVTETSPEALREEFPVGTSVRFSVEGSEAHVSVRRP